MTDSLIVIAGVTVAGSLALLPGGRLRFSYNEQYTARPDATPLSLSMPLTQLTHPDSVITPWQWGLLPDDPSVLARWERHFHLSRAVPFTLLGTPIGLDCPGAVRFARPEQTDQAMHGAGHVNWLTEDDVARVLGELGRDSTSWLGLGFTGQFSLAGAGQDRTALSEWTVGDPLRAHADHPHPQARDRRAGRARPQRVHQEDLCQALAVPPTRKYQNEGGPGPRDIASALPYGDHENKLRQAMKIGGDYQLNPHRNSWPDAARDLGLPAAELVARARELAATAPDALADAAKASDVLAQESGLPARLTDLVAERSARCARLLGG